MKILRLLRLLRLVGIVFAICFAGLGIYGLKQGLQTSSWASAPAKIVMSEAAGKGEHRSSLVMAEYRVGSDIYQCGHVRAGRNNAASDAKRFPVGAAATVIYDPANVTRCALEGGVSPISIGFLAAAAAFLGVAVFAHRRMASAGASIR